MGILYRPGPLTAIKDEFRRLQFLDFVHQGGDLNCLVDMLLLLQQGRTRRDLPQRLPQYSGGLFHMLTFLCDQDLVRQLKGKRDGKAVYKAIPNAIEELAHRLEHEGAASPPFPEDDGMDQKRAIARNKVKAALKAGGWKGTTNRLRVVR